MIFKLACQIPNGGSLVKSLCSRLLYSIFLSLSLSLSLYLALSLSPVNLSRSLMLVLVTNCRTLFALYRGTSLIRNCPPP